MLSTLMGKDEVTPIDEDPELIALADRMKAASAAHDRAMQLERRFKFILADSAVAHYGQVEDRGVWRQATDEEIGEAQECLRQETGTSLSSHLFLPQRRSAAQAHAEVRAAYDQAVERKREAIRASRVKTERALTKAVSDQLDLLLGAIDRREAAAHESGRLLGQTIQSQRWWAGLKERAEQLQVELAGLDPAAGLTPGSHS